MIKGMRGYIDALVTLAEGERIAYSDVKKSLVGVTNGLGRARCA